MASTKKLLICTFIIIAIALVAGLFPVHGEEEIYDTVVRLHVLANSDDEADQALKLKVRDEVIDLVTPVLKDCRSRADAMAEIEKIIPEIEKRAGEAVIREGFAYPVEVELCEEYYPTKQYESCAFPKGKYTSLTVKIGESGGQNWWCCLFPPLCLSAASEQSVKDNEDAFISVGLTGDQYKLITRSDSPKYKIRFKILEALSGMFDR